MSWVSGVTLQISVCEDSSEQSDGSDAYPLLDRVNEWLSANSFPPLTNVTEHYRCGKHPQVEVLGAGYNNFPEDEFANFVMALPWEMPECCVLLINPEEGPTRIWRAVSFRIPLKETDT